MFANIIREFLLNKYTNRIVITEDGGLTKFTNTDL